MDHIFGARVIAASRTEILDIEAKISSEISEKLLLRLTTEERRQLDETLHG